jgi:hypothetical protein
LDDWQNNWPILGELGDRPDEWIERRGLGVSKVTSTPIGGPNIQYSLMP